MFINADRQLSRESISENDDLGEFKETLKFAFDPEFLDENPREYNILFKLSFEYQAGVAFNVEFLSTFQTDGDISEDFKNSPFVFVNSPAIAYPFLRAFVSNILLMSGYQPLMLPTINFQKIHSEKKSQ